MHGLDSTLETIRRELDLALSEKEAAVRRALARDLSQFTRRIRQYHNEPEWIATVLNGAKLFADKSAILTWKDGNLTLRAEFNFNLAADLSVPTFPASAFAAAIESKEPVISLRTSAEVTSVFAEPGSGRLQILPISNGARVVAVLVSEAENESNFEFLELIAEIAAAALERHANTQIHTQISSSNPGPPPANGPAPSALPAWSELPPEHRNLHIRAQRFSRAKIAEMQLARPEAFRAGLQQSNLYLYLKAEIDRARDLFRKEFVTIPTMVDYFHMELVRAADEDEAKLGAEYPGQLV